MRARMYMFGVCVAAAASSAYAHGPQIQITNDNNKIVTRRLIQDGPYSDSLTAAKSVYVLPVAADNGVWYSKPSNEIDPITILPAFPSGPGLAYGYDQADGGAQAFAEGSVLSVSFVDGLKLWNGAGFVDPGVTELKGFRGSNAGITTPAANFAVTSDSGPFDSLSLAAVAANYGSELREVHSSLRWALLGDGTSSASASPDGVYLVKLQLSSTQVGLATSDPYYFLLDKNAASEEIAAAVASLGIAPELVQFVPEPGTWLLVAIGLAGLGGVPLATRCRSRQ